MQTSGRKWPWVLGAVGVALTAFLTWNYWPIEGHITIGYDTTRITGPVNADGTVNYVAYLNAKYSEGVTKENNAAIPLLKIAGPEVLEAKVRDQVLDALDMDLSDPNISKFVLAKDHFGDLDYDIFTKPTTAPWSADDHPAIASWLELNTEPLKQLVAASKLPRFYIPLVSAYTPPTLASASTLSLGPFHDIAPALAARAMLRLSADNIDGACEDTLAYHRLARLVGQDMTVIGSLVAIVIESRAARAAIAIATSEKLSVAQANRYLQEYQSLPPLPGLENAFECEHFVSLDYVMLCARGEASRIIEVKAPLSQLKRVDWDISLRMFNQLHDDLIRALSVRDTAEQKRQFQSAGPDMKEGSSKLDYVSKLVIHFATGDWKGVRKMRGDKYGKLLLAVLAPELFRISTFQKETRMRSDLLQLSFALAAHKAETGAYPAELAALSPKYLKKIPLDLFTDQPLHYNRTVDGYLLYSVGKNMIDDGGKKKVKGDDDYDIVVRVESSF